MGKGDENDEFDIQNQQKSLGEMRARVGRVAGGFKATGFPGCRPGSGKLRPLVRGNPGTKGRPGRLRGLRRGPELAAALISSARERTVDLGIGRRYFRGESRPSLHPAARRTAEHQEAEGN